MRDPIPVLSVDRRLRVHPDRRFLQREDGAPFFLLGDTAWELLHRCNREDAVRYLDTRRAQGFTAVQTVVLAEFDGLRTPNAEGHLPLHDDDPACPNDAYFRHVDWVVAEANRRGLWVGLLPTWGDKWKRIPVGVGPQVFTVENARGYGAYLGRRYRDVALYWILGGDRRLESDEERALLRAMAAGLREGDGGRHLMTFHPAGGHFTAGIIAEPWLDFTMVQSGHMQLHPYPYDLMATDYAMTPTKPCLDGEPCYENHPVMLEGWTASDRRFDAWQARQAAYWAVFAGACGHVYGAHSVWQFWQEGREPVNGPDLPWRESLELPGAEQMRHLRRLLEERPFFTRVPDQGLLLSDAGGGDERVQATRDEAGTFALVYFPCHRAARLDLAKLRGRQVRARWFDPRTGDYLPPSFHANTEAPVFMPPSEPGPDWVLCLDAVIQPPASPSGRT